MDAEVFTVRDSAADRFLTPFMSDTVETAIRQFKEACLADGHQFNKFPEDYVLYHIGTFYAETGALDGFEVPRKILNAVNVAGIRPSEVLDGA